MPTRAGQACGIGPAIGRVMADLPTGHAAGHDLARFRPARFADGSEIVPGPYWGGGGRLGTNRGCWAANDLLRA